MKFIRYYRLALIIFIFSVTLLIVNQSNAADDLYKLVSDGGLKDVASEAYGGGTPLDPRVIIARIITKVLGFLGIILTALIMYSGFEWFTAGGDKAKIDSARKRISNAVIGLVIILSSYSIVNFVLECVAMATEKGIITSIMCPR